MRIDRLLSLYLFDPLSRILKGTSSNHGSIRLPILMYHSISKNPESRHPYYWINTSPNRFAEHMKFLHDHKYQVISLNMAVKMIENGMPPERAGNSELGNNQFGKENKNKYVVITFDDGYRDFLTDAYPVLKHYCYTAAVFLPTIFMQDKRVKFKGRECLIWDEVRDLAKKNIEFGSYTVTHPQLRFLKKKEVEYEIGQSKRELIDQIGNRVDFFSCPYAFPDDDSDFKKSLMHILMKNGYRGGVTTSLGTNTCANKWLLQRVPVNEGDDHALFQTKLGGGYDWLGTVQKPWKSLKKRLGLNSPPR
jgi:peptidoglycan/xylan/chitin deacetylase (PgdA/CDA1 family)